MLGIVKVQNPDQHCRTHAHDYAYTTKCTAKILFGSILAMSLHFFVFGVIIFE